MSILPLEGIRIINFGAAAAAPAVAMILGGFGAEVIKVESKGRPDSLRYIRPLVYGLSAEDTIEVSGLFLEHNQNSKSIQANLKNPEAIDLLKKLVKKSDVVLENWAPRVMPSLGLGYEDLKKVKPDIIMASMSALGSFGPQSHMLAYAPTLGALSGIDSMIGYPDGGKAIDNFAGDYTSGMMTALLIMAAIHYRNRTGKGQVIDLGEVEPIMYMMGEPLMELTMNKRVMKPAGNRRPGFCPSNAYPCKGTQQWISIAVKTEEEWQYLCNAMGNPSWTKKSIFAERSNRIHNQDELDKLISEWTKTMSKYEAMYLLQEAGVAAMPLMDEDNWPVDPHFVAREALGLHDSPLIKRFQLVDVPLKLSETPGKNVRGPVTGEHNDYVYGEILGLSKEKIENLKKEKAIF